MNSKEKKEASSQKNKIVINYSIKKRLLTRDWNEEHVIGSQEKNIKTLSKKKSVSFIKDIEAIPSPRNDFVLGTPNKPIITTENKLKSCKEHIKTPYSKERPDERSEGNDMQNCSGSKSKPKLLTAQKLALSELKDQPIDKYLLSSAKGQNSPKGNDSLILSEKHKSSLSKKKEETGSVTKEEIIHSVNNVNEDHVSDNEEKEDEDKEGNESN